MRFCDLKYYEYVTDHEYERSKILTCMRYDQKMPLISTVQERDERWDWIQDKTVSLNPNQDLRRCRIMEWLIVSKAAERSRRHRPVTCHWLMALIMWSCTHGRLEGGARGSKCSPWIWSFCRKFGQNTIILCHNILTFGQNTNICSP